MNLIEKKYFGKMGCIDPWNPEMGQNLYFSDQSEAFSVSKLGQKDFNNDSQYCKQKYGYFDA